MSTDRHRCIVIEFIVDRSNINWVEAPARPVAVQTLTCVYRSCLHVSGTLAVPHESVSRFP